jgi:hypothetical protein
MFSFARARVTTFTNHQHNDQKKKQRSTKHTHITKDIVT